MNAGDHRRWSSTVPLSSAVASPAEVRSVLSALRLHILVDLFRALAQVLFKCR